jgi:4-hydroxy-tetrahydrodipicolinate reductase
MRIALIGYGKMGKEIERLALDRQWSVDLKIDIDTPRPPASSMAGMDVAIHFAGPQTILQDITPWVEIGTALVIGTTGWNQDLGAVRSLIERKGTGMVYASNFSLGVSVFARLVQDAARMMDKLEEYDVSIHEIHHKEKIDSPSGTALTLAGVILGELKRKKEILSQPPAGKIEPNQMHVSSSRTGAVVGVHTVTFDSEADTIELTHSAKNRSGFAFGALVAAEWIRGKKGVFTMNDVVQDLMKPEKG